MPAPSLNTGSPGLNFEEIMHASLACGVFSIDASAKINFVSPEAEKILQLRPADATDPEKLPESLRKLIRETQTTGRVISDRRIELDRDQATAVSVTVMPAAPKEKNSRVLVLLKDFSAANKLEHSLQRLDRLASAGTLSAGMAHEIRNALVAVKTFIDLLLEKNKDAELADLVRHEMRRVDSIVSQMLKFTAPAQPAFAKISLHKILDRSLRLAQHRVESRLIAFERHFEAETDSLKGDENQLEQAFVNLLLNAVEAINAHGSLTVATEIVGDSAAHLREGGPVRMVRVRISDTGSGIAPENMSRLFKPFFTTKRNGTGLGLAVTHRIIIEHGGSIDVASLPGKGTTFTILLPTRTS